MARAPRRRRPASSTARAQRAPAKGKPAKSSAAKSSAAKSSAAKSKAAKGKIAKVMHEFKEGDLRSSSGAKVTRRKQAIAIALSEGRRTQRKRRRA
jgi:hypothetical protein